MNVPRDKTSRVTFLEFRVYPVRFDQFAVPEARLNTCADLRALYLYIRRGSCDNPVPINGNTCPKITPPAGFGEISFTCCDQDDPDLTYT